MGDFLENNNMSSDIRREALDTYMSNLCETKNHCGLNFFPTWFLFNLQYFLAENFHFGRKAAFSPLLFFWVRPFQRINLKSTWLKKKSIWNWFIFTQNSQQKPHSFSFNTRKMHVRRIINNSAKKLWSSLFIELYPTQIPSARFLVHQINKWLNTSIIRSTWFFSYSSETHCVFWEKAQKKREFGSKKWEFLFKTKKNQVLKVFSCLSLQHREGAA